MLPLLAALYPLLVLYLIALVTAFEKRLGNIACYRCLFVEEFLHLIAGHLSLIHQTANLALYALRFGMFVENLDLAMWVLTVIGFLGQVGTIVVLLLASFNKNVTTKVIGGIFKLLGRIHILKNVDQKIKKLDESLTNFHNCNKDLNKDKTLVIKVYVITFVQLTVLFLVPYCIAKSFGKEGVQMFDMLCAQSFVSMVSGLVPLPGGSGAAEYCFSAFFGTTFDEATIKSAILIWRTITYYGTIMISLPFSSIKKKAVQAEVSDEKESAKD